MDAGTEIRHEEKPERVTVFRVFQRYQEPGDPHVFAFEVSTNPRRRQDIRHLHVVGQFVRARLELFAVEFGHCLGELFHGLEIFLRQQIEPFEVTGLARVGRERKRQKCGENQCGRDADRTCHGRCGLGEVSS